MSIEAFISIVSGVITVVGFFFSLVKGLKDVNEKALLIILAFFSLPTVMLMLHMEKPITLDFSTLLFLGSVFSHFVLAVWVPHICINSLKSTSENKELNLLIAVILYALLCLIAYIGFFAMAYIFNELMSKLG